MAQAVDEDMKFNEKDLTAASKKFVQMEPMFGKYMNQYDKDIVALIGRGEKPDADSALAIAGAQVFKSLGEIVLGMAFAPLAVGVLVVAKPIHGLLNTIKDAIESSSDEEDNNDKDADFDGVADDPNANALIANLLPQVVQLAGKQAFRKTFKQVSKHAIKQIAKFVLKCIQFVMKLVGLSFKVNEKMVEWIIKELGEEVFDELAGIINSFDESETGSDEQGSVLMEIVSILFEKNLFELAFNAMIETYEWWEWLVMAIVTVCQFIIWFATGGAVFIAKAIHAIKNAADLLDAAVDVVKLLV